MQCYMIFGLLQQSAAGERGPSEARGPWHSAIVPPTKDGPDDLDLWPPDPQLTVSRGYVLARGQLAHQNRFVRFQNIVFRALVTDERTNERKDRLKIMYPPVMCGLARHIPVAFTVCTLRWRPIMHHNRALRASRPILAVCYCVRFITSYHGLYGSTSCFISQWSK